MKIWAFLILIFPHISFSSIKNFELVIDQSKEQVYSPFDTGYSGLSRFSTSVQEMGGTVSVNFLPLDKFLKEFSGPGRVLLLGVAMYQTYSEKELSAIKDFLRSGGGVLAIVEHDNFFKNQDFQNSLTEEFGIIGIPKQALADEKTWDGVIWPQCYEDELKDIFLYLPSPLKVGKKASAILKVNNPRDKKLDIVGASAQVGKGKLIVLGDMEILWNFAKNAGIRKSKNKAFIKKIISDLSGRGRDFPIPSFRNHFTGGTILFYSGSGALIPHHSPSGLLKFAQDLNKKGFNIEVDSDLNHIDKYELVVMAVPVKPIDNPEKLLKAKKILFIADGQSNFFAREHQKKIKIFREDLNLDFDLKDYENPLNSILIKHGLELHPGTLIKKGKNHFIVNGDLITVRKSGVFVLKKDLSNLSGKFKDSYVLETFEPNTPRKEHGDPFSKDFRQNSLSTFPLVVKNSKFMAIADLELLSNQFFKEKDSKLVSKMVQDWLR